MECSELLSTVEWLCCHVLKSRIQIASGPLEQAVQAAGSKLEFVQDNRVTLDTFEAGTFFGALNTASLGHVLLSSRRTTSTQVLLQDSLRSLPDGVVFVADRQSIGKGESNKMERRGL